MMMRPQHDDDSDGHSRSRRPADRIVLDVGGQEFVTSRSSLKNHSAYFEAMLSLEWDHGEHFLDQDPETFKILLAYMRTGMMNTADVSKEVLLLAEYLGIESLVHAVKVKCSDKDHASDEEAIAQFDEKYGTIWSFIEAGLLPLSSTSEPKMEYAVIRIDNMGRCRVECKELNVTIDNIVGALNAVHYLGYNEEKMDMRFPVHASLYRFFRTTTHQRAESIANLLIDSTTQKPQKRKLFAAAALLEKETILL